MRDLLLGGVVAAGLAVLAACGDGRPELTPALEKRLVHDCKNQILLGSLFLNGVKDETPYTIDGDVGSLNWYCCERDKAYPAWEIRFNGRDTCYAYLKGDSVFGRSSASKCGATSPDRRDKMCSGRF